MNRRHFLSWTGAGWLSSFLPAAIAACRQPNTPSPGPQGFQTVGSLAELQTGPILVTQGLRQGPALIVRPPRSNALVAVNPTCTHAGCTVNWQADQTAFVCPCHGSKFDLSGKAIKGPAVEPLKTYKVKTEGDQVLVQG